MAKKPRKPSSRKPARRTQTVFSSQTDPATGRERLIMQDMVVFGTKSGQKFSPRKRK